MLVKDKDGNITGYDLSKDPAFTKLVSDFSEVGKLVKGLTPIMQSVISQNGEFKRKLEALESGSGRKPANDDDNDIDDDDVDLGKIEPKKFRNLLLGEVGKLLDDRLGKVNESVSVLRRDVVTKEFREEAKELAGKFKDFKDWEDEMGVLAKANPNLSLKQLYRLARDENEDKAKELDEKYKEPEKPKDELTMFGGYRPSTGTETGGKGNEKLTAEEAGEKAWNETVAAFPGFEKFAGDDKVFIGN